MTAELSQIFKYWGKAKKSEQQGGDEYHLLPYHCLDVAACGWVLMSGDYPWCKRLAAELGVSTEQLRRIFVFFLCVHDIGKFARSFQGQVPDVLKETKLSADGYRYTVRHDSLGYQLWRDRFQGIQVLLAELLGISPDKVRANAQLNSWFEIVTGHHGQPPLIEPIHLADHFHADDKSAVQAFISWAWRFWLQPEDIDFLLDKAAGKKLKGCSWRFAGLAVLADWQGSNQEFFKYRSLEMDLQDYWEQWAVPKAIEAVAMAGLKPFAVAPFADIQQLFPFITNPTPLQQCAISMPMGCEPQLFILEDVTGAGKTEAAMVLLHRLMSKGLASGLFVGLPTMATANGMYKRLAKCYQQLFGAGQQPSLVLAHGARQLSDEFMKSVSGQELDADYAEDEQSASAYCNSWIADSRKKSLLADIGVGTIDQALLGILPSRHQSLRLLGLDGKVLLVDEVHAYDPYMQSLLACLLEAHAAQGGSAILLSATLPQQMKNRLVASYAKGRGFPKPQLSNSAYPLLTRFPATTDQQEVELETRREVRRQVQVSRLDDEAAAHNLILEAVKAGKCVCWIRNTVKVARNSFQFLVKQLEQQGADATRVHLFHSRFAMADRQTIEDSVLDWFGRDSTEQQRHGRVLISTQVVEQSLDLDFDVLITDLAPVDLLLQRAGRLHRHVRDERGNRLSEDGAQDQRGAAIFYVFSPDPEVNADTGWLNSQKGSVAVYQDLGQLWRSAKVLFDSGSYRMPDDARHLIESVYSPESSIVTPEAVEQASSEAEGKRRSQFSMGNFNQLKLDAGYSRKSSDAWGEEINIPTRLSDQTVSVVLVKQTDGGQWRPYADQQKHGWELSALQMRMELWEKAEKTIPQDLRAVMDSLREEIPVLKWYALMPLVGELKEWYDAQSGWMDNKGDAR